MPDYDGHLTIDLSSLDRPIEPGDLLRIEHRDGKTVLVQVIHVSEDPAVASSGEGE
jgi:hypothetical protein